jgi:glycosyltransferase involved in cell wall biosynthesis
MKVGIVKPDHIVINSLSLLSKLTGIGKYTFEICKRITQAGLNADIDYFYGYYSKKLYMMNIPPSGKIVKKVKEYLSRFYLVKKMTRESLLFVSRFSHRSFDLYWEPNIVPLEHIQSKHLITTIHDFSFQHYPECLPKENKEYLQHYFWKNIQKSDRIITGSNYIKNEIIDLLHYDAARIKVIYHGVDHDNFRTYDCSLLQEFKKAHKLPEKFILFVGSIEPRKNLENVLRGYNALPEAFKKEIKFVLAGFSGWKNREIMDIIKREDKNIVYLGYLSNLDLAYLYNLAGGFIYASLYEGFGIPPLEAMACGTPVIVSRSSSLPEVCGDAAYYVDPLSVDSISEGMYKIFDDSALREKLTRRGVIHAKSFSWDDSARSHLSLFNEVLHQ